MRKPRPNRLMAHCTLVAALLALAGVVLAFTGSLGQVSDFEWSADSESLLVFVCHWGESAGQFPNNRYVAHVRPGGLRVTNLSDLPARGAPSRDGTLIAFVKDEGVLRPAVYLTDPDLKACRRIFDREFPTYADVLGLAWVPGSESELLVWCVAQTHLDWSACWIVDTNTGRRRQVWSSHQPDKWIPVRLDAYDSHKAVDPPFRFSSDGRLLLVSMVVWRKVQRTTEKGYVIPSWDVDTDQERVLDLSTGTMRLRRADDRFPLQPTQSVRLPRERMFLHFAYAAGSLGFQYLLGSLASGEPQDWETAAGAVQSGEGYPATREQDVLLSRIRGRSACFGETPDIVYSVDRRYLYRCSLAGSSTEIVSDFHDWKRELGLKASSWVEPLGTIWYDTESSKLVMRMTILHEGFRPFNHRVNPLDKETLLVAYDLGVGTISVCRDEELRSRYMTRAAARPERDKEDSPDGTWYAEVRYMHPLTIGRVGTDYQVKVPAYVAGY